MSTPKPNKSIQDLFAKTVTLELNDVSGKSTGLKLKVVGQDSKQYRDAVKSLYPFAGKDPLKLTSDELDKMQQLKVETTVGFIVGWENDDAFGGEYTPEYAKTLFGRPEAKFILDQVEVFAAERANFLSGSKK